MLVWEKNTSSVYTTKARDIYLSKEEEQSDIVQWWRGDQKFNCPSKYKFFMWFLLNNKALMWDNLQKNN